RRLPLVTKGKLRSKYFQVGRIVARTIHEVPPQGGKILFGALQVSARGWDERYGVERLNDHSRRAKGTEGVDLVLLRARRHEHDRYIRGVRVLLQSGQRCGAIHR